MPGDPADRLDSPAVPAEQAERNRRALGLDRPVGVQLLRRLASYASGDLGVSFTRKRPVDSVLVDALPSTALLGSAALLLAYGIGLPLALLLVALPARWRRRADRGLLALAVTPRFWLGVMLIFLLHGLAGWFPASHAGPPGGGGWIDRLRHLVLPALALGLPAACVVGRYQLAVMERVLDDPHVRSARAAGAGGVRLFGQHVLRPSLGPAIALFVLDLPVLVSGAIVVEVIFAWPGVGRLTAEAVLASDYPLALAAAMLAAVVVVGGRFLAEALAHAMHPRQAASLEEGGA
jgi:peptide/nickel transport system permease protein